MVMSAHDSRWIMAGLHQTLLELATADKLDVATFMQHALYHPDGYYAKSTVWGKHGDYITSPDITQVFGEMVALWVMKEWEANQRPSCVQLVEMGPGNGTMIKDMLRTFRVLPDFNKALQAIHVLDIRPHHLEILDPRIQAHACLSEVSLMESDAACYIVSNEFLDALPVQQYLPDGIIQHIDWRNDTWEFRHPTNTVCEICPQAESIVANIKRLISLKGGMLAFDYGHTSQGYHTSTLQALHEHRYVPFLSHVGRADLTCHVNWNHWINQAGGTSTLTNQGSWLLQMGAEERTRALVKNATTSSQAHELWTALARLVDSAHMGDLFQAWTWHTK